MAERRVVDTSVASLFLKAVPSPDAARYEPHLLGYDLVMPFMTFVEMLWWPVRHGWSQRRIDQLEAYIAANYSLYYADEALCRRLVRLRADLRAAGLVLADADAWIAATALELGAPLVTHNRRHFNPVAGLMVISEAP